VAQYQRRLTPKSASRDAADVTSTDPSTLDPNKHFVPLRCRLGDFLNREPEVGLTDECLHLVQI
jgi:hypothetical protein